MKIIAFYLPQFHEIPENDEWWGKGFTEWTNLKKAKPLFPGHYQPRKPLGGNYYDLLDPAVQEWQATIAQSHGIYGFCYYHYWFGGHMLLQKPAENMLARPSVSMPFCFCWANENWTKAWVSQKNTVLISETFGNEQEWIKHFEYLKPFFLDKRYIKYGNKPLFIIYRPELIDCLPQMLECWNSLAIKAGFDGVCFAFQQRSYHLSAHYDPSLFDFEIEYQPGFSEFDMNKRFPKLRKIYRSLSLFAEKHLHIDARFLFDKKLSKLDYDEIWKEILSHEPESPKSIAGAFVDWDNTPRRGEKGSVIVGASPEKFKTYFSQQISHVVHSYSTDFLFIFAWNEWSEGGYLEPDEKFGYSYLEAIKESLKIQ